MSCSSRKAKGRWRGSCRPPVELVALPRAIALPAALSLSVIDNHSHHAMAEPWQGSAIFLLLVLAVALLAPAAAQASSVAEEVQTSWRLLDYIAVDYPAAVRGGRVVNPAEYQEMTRILGLGQRAAGGPPGQPPAFRAVEGSGRPARRDRSQGRRRRHRRPGAQARLVAARRLSGAAGPRKRPRPSARRRALRPELRVLPRRQGRRAGRANSPSSTRRRSLSPIAPGPATAACSASTRSFPRALKGRRCKALPRFPRRIAGRWPSMSAALPGAILPRASESGATMPACAA